MTIEVLTMDPGLHPLQVGGGLELGSPLMPRRIRRTTRTSANERRTGAARVVNPDTPSMSRRLGTFWLTACLLVAGMIFGKAVWLPPSHSGIALETTTIAREQPHTQAIETIRVGDRVFADNPEVATSSDTQVDPATWRKMRLKASTRWNDGTQDVTEIETLQPPEWIAAHCARVGASVPIPLDLVEMGLPEGLRAEVVSIAPCPPIKEGSGRVVLTTVNHLNRDVYALTVRDQQGREETVRPTGLHKFYRSNDGSWVSTEDLRAGDFLIGVHGRISVVSLRRVPGTHRVYNMTVEGEHVYHVSTLGLLTHNTSCIPRGTLPRAPNGDYLPDPKATGAHTRLGTRIRPTGPEPPYTQGATFDRNGNFVGRTDCTTHARPNHPAPHFHPATSPNSVAPGPHPLPAPDPIVFGP
jgi:Pretoxin HINT domain